MTTFKFYGRDIVANARNTKLLVFVYAPIILALTLVAYGLSAWALATFSGISLWLTLPFVILLCLELTFKSGPVAIAPKNVRTTLLRILLALALYVFWRDKDFIQLSIVAAYLAHVLIHKVIGFYLGRKRAREADKAQMEKGLKELGYGQRAPSSNDKH